LLAVSRVGVDDALAELAPADTNERFGMICRQLKRAIRGDLEMASGEGVH
jgi:hypothetical protein